MRVKTTYPTPARRLTSVKKRDTQKIKEYRSEWDLHNSNITGKPFKTETEMQRYADNLLKQKWVVKMYREIVGSDSRKPVATVRFADNARQRRAQCVGTQLVIIPQTEFGQCEMTLLHELGHVLTPNDVGHGWQFCHVMLRLVKNRMGKEVHDTLRENYRKHKVRYKRPRNLKPETREKLRVAAMERFHK